MTVPDSNPEGSRSPAGTASPVSRRVFLGALGVAAALSVVPRPSEAAAASAAYTLRSRAAWGANETLRYAADGTEIWPPEYYPVQTLTVHHTDDGSSDPDPAAVVRAIYRNDTVGKGYGDIGYNFLIDKNGLVYEGRWSGTDGVPAHDVGADGHRSARPGIQQRKPRNRPSGDADDHAPDDRRTHRAHPAPGRTGRAPRDRPLGEGVLRQSGERSRPRRACHRRSPALGCHRLPGYGLRRHARHTRGGGRPDPGLTVRAYTALPPLCAPEG